MGTEPPVTTWDTDEVERWIDNEEYLYLSIAGRGLSPRSIRKKCVDIPGIRLGDVDWDWLATVYGSTDTVGGPESADWGSA